MKSKITNDREYGTGAIQILRKRVQIVTKEGDTMDFLRSEFEPPFADLLTKLEGHRLDPAKYTTSADGSVLYSFAPASGAHVVRFINFAAQKDSLPAPKLQTGGPRTAKDGRHWVAPDKLVFTSVLEILTGNFEGCQIIYQLDYLFEKDGKEAMIAGKKTANAKLSEFLQVLGLDLATLTIPWPKDGNVLPFLEEEILSADAVFQVVIKDGWVDSVSELPVGFAVPKRSKVALDEPEDDEPSDEELLAQAKAARAAAKAEATPEAKKAFRKAVEAAEDEEGEDVPDTKPTKKVGKPVEPEPEEDDEPEEARQPVSKAAKAAVKVQANPEPGDGEDDDQEEDTGDDTVDFFSAKASAKRKELDEAAGVRTKKIVSELTGEAAEEADEAPAAPAKKRRAF